MSFSSGRSRSRGVLGVDATRSRATVALAASLVVGLVAVAPAVAWLLGLAGLSGPLPVFVGVGVVGAGYGLLVLLADRLTLGAIVATVVTATFAADFPLAAGANALPGSLGPELWLVHLPLLGLAGLLAARGAFSASSFSRVEYVLGAFVAWSGVVALVAPAPRPDVALYYALFSLFCLLAFGAARRGVRSGLVTLPGVLAAFLVAVGGHVAFAALQLANQDVFGLSALGETTRIGSRTAIGLGPLGSFHIGVFVSGFTGGSGPLSVLLVLALPLALAVAIRREGRERVGMLLAVVAMAAILRFTAKDAARGAAMIAVALFGAYLVGEHRERLLARPGWRRRLAPHAALAVAAVGSLFLPSTIAAREGPGSPGSGGGSAAAGGAGGSAPELAVPFFNLNTLPVRIAQYVVGADIALRHPLLGVGGGNFRYVATDYGVAAIDGVALHNLYLSLLVGTGLPGLALYSLALALVLLAGWRLLRARTADRTFVAALLAGFVGFLAVSFWVLPLRFTYALPAWLLAGALVGRAELAVDRPETVPTVGGSSGVDRG